MTSRSRARPRSRTGWSRSAARWIPTRCWRPTGAGIFPWSSDPVLTWWSPDPRAIFDLGTYRPHRSVGRDGAPRAAGASPSTATSPGVMRALRRGRRPSAPRPGSPTTSCASYGELHRRGHAHSVEVYEGDELVGGLYGVTIGGFFGGESMFHRRTDASKAAVGLPGRAAARGRLHAARRAGADAAPRAPRRGRHPARRVPGPPARARWRVPARLPRRPERHSNETVSAAGAAVLRPVSVGLHRRVHADPVAARALGLVHDLVGDGDQIGGRVHARLAARRATPDADGHARSACPRTTNACSSTARRSRSASCSPRRRPCRAR